MQRFRCAKTYIEEHAKPLGEMTIPMGKAILAIKLLAGGSSIRTIERITDLHRDTICRLLVFAGEKAEKSEDITSENQRRFGYSRRSGEPAGTSN